MTFSITTQPDQAPTVTVTVTLGFATRASKVYKKRKEWQRDYMRKAREAGKYK
jgi:hypothetical protein